MTENLEARARSDGSPAWQRKWPKDNIPDLTRRGARQPQDGIARGDVPARDDARGVWPPRPAQPRGASMRPDDARVRANTLGPVFNKQQEISLREIRQDGRGAHGDEQGLRVRLRVLVRIQVRPLVRRAGARRQDRQDRRALRHPILILILILTLHHLRIQGMVGQGWQDRPKHHRSTRRRRAPLLRPHLQHLLRLLPPRCHVLVV